MKKTITILLIFLVIITIGLAAWTCTNTEAATLEDTTWVLESYGQQDNMTAVIEGSEITAIFDSSEGQVKGSAGCNNYFAGYKVDDNQLSIYDAGSTSMFCEGVMEQENRYLALLQGAETFQIQSGQLLIFCSGNQVLTYGVQ